MAAGSRGLSAVGDAGESALGPVDRGVNGIGEWLDSHFPGGPGLKPATAGGPSAAPAALDETPDADNVFFAKRHTVQGEEGRGKLQGHTIERHVGQTETNQRNRFRKELDIKAASTFENEAVANRVVGDALKNKDNEQLIQAWLADNSSQSLKLKVDEGKTIGNVLERGASAPKDTSIATVVLGRASRATAAIL